MIDRRAFFRNRIPQYRKNIALFAGEVLQFTPDDWQRTVFRSIEQNRYINFDFRIGIMFEQLMLDKSIDQEDKLFPALHLYYGDDIPRNVDEAVVPLCR